MTDYLVVRGWSGRRKIPVNIISETEDGFQIKALERVFLPGRGILKQGQSTFVSKSVVMVEPRAKAVPTGLWSKGCASVSHTNPSCPRV